MLIQHICNKFINYITNNVKENNINIIGETLRFIHGLCPYLSIIFIMFCNKYLVLCVLYFMFFLLFLFLFNENRCMISYIEKELLHDNEYVTDPYLRYINLDTRKDHRIILSYFAFSIHLYTIYLIYHYRFLCNKNTFS